MPLIEVNGLRKEYGGRPVVDGVSFTVEDASLDDAFLDLTAQENPT
ncbi:hypothetical protein NMN56_025130 [Streptomyces iconiensis]|uniref:ABC-2 type transport system ATP-binding protein n=1 Tax=Streptomyces iconiensis TaxID=1384038 RepID=A0ABT7A1H2_9ACTN|nr:hypothetical protein [Streptomyces iconiensis]MDJ1135185.1 hypothetical protein [Streptomyces iconiensis]